MSRRRRGRSAPESLVPAVEAATPVSGAVQSVQQFAQPNRRERRREQAGHVPAFVFSRPVVVDKTKADIDDYILVSTIGTLGQAGNEAAFSGFIQAHMVEIHAFLNRVVVGGTAGRPMSEFMPLLIEVFKQIGNSGN